MAPEFEGWAMLGGWAVPPGDIPGEVSVGALGGPGRGAGLMVWAQAKCAETIKAAEVSQSVRMVISFIGVDFTLASRWHVGRSRGCNKNIHLSGALNTRHRMPVGIMEARQNTRGGLKRLLVFVGVMLAPALGAWADVPASHGLCSAAGRAGRAGQCLAGEFAALDRAWSRAGGPTR